MNTITSLGDVAMESCFNAIADPLIVVTAEGRIETVNPAALNLLGYPDDALIGQPLQTIAPGDTLMSHVVKESQNSELTGSRSIQVECRTNDGVIIPILFSCARVQADNRSLIILSGKDLRSFLVTIHRLHEENLYLQEEIKAEHNFEEIIGSSDAINNVFRIIQKVAETDSSVLLRGETGTGKELIARAIHNLSPRKSKPLIKVSCETLSAGLVESELFGHEKGAYTGAIAQRIGRFELADGGTVFLDEIGELHSETQVKLLRVLQEQQFERVGGTKTIDVDVRIIAATNRNLEEEVQAGLFRADLFYRLNVFPVNVPPLRERVGDIPILSQFFLSRFSRKINKTVRRISKKGMEKLVRYPWPGNVRELANVLERAVILSDKPVIGEAELLMSGLVTNRKTSITLAENQRAHILAALTDCKGVIQGKGGAAARLGIHPATLRSRMKTLGIVRNGTTFGPKT